MELVCVVEIPKGTRNKYEYDPTLGGIKFEAVREIELARERFRRA
jgi:inorganic pyrophosphatase